MYSTVSYLQFKRSYVLKVVEKWTSGPGNEIPDSELPGGWRLVAPS